MPRNTAQLFRNGRSQAVRLPKEFRFEGTQVSIRRVKDGILLEAMGADLHAWFAELDELKSAQFRMSRSQPSTPSRKLFD